MIKTGLIWSAILIMAMIGISVYGWFTLPDGEMIARHWDLQGNANGFSSKNQILIGQPIAAIVLTAVLAIVPVIDPRRSNLLKSSALYLSAWIGSLLLLTFVHGSIIHSAANQTMPDINLMFGGIGVFFIVLGNFMAKSKSNWFAGVRTPWTLSSEHAWSVANRIGGYLFVFTGIVTILSVFFFPAQVTIFTFIGGTLVATIVSAVASYFAWKNDPETTTTGS
jgi:uncharacterized membrane protein